MPSSELYFNLWFVVAGVLFVTLALSSTVLRRLPLTTALLYLAIGIALGPFGLGLAAPDPFGDALLLERLAEIVVLVSLFSAGLKLRTPVNDRRWWIPLRLATLSMALTIGMITAAGVFLLTLPLGAALLLGAILAPTDPVLASDVQVEDPTDTDRLRFGLTGEAGLNDGAAFPFVMLGLGFIGAHELGEAGVRWVLVDVIWSIFGGLGIGAILGTAIGKLILHLREVHRESIGTDDFLALGLIALSYGAGLFAHAYGFLAVFSAGLALRRIERLSTDPVSAPAAVRAAAGTVEGEDQVDGADAEQHTPAYMAGAVLGFSEQLERIGTVGIVLIVGTMLSPDYLSLKTIAFIAILSLIIRPVSVIVGLAGSGTARVQVLMMSWFGIRGIGSIYYLMYGLEHGLSGPAAHQVVPVVLTVIAASAILHGLSVTPLMKAYSGWARRSSNSAA